MTCKKQKNYLKHDKNGEVSGYLFGQNYYQLRAGLFPLNSYNKFNKKLDLSIYPICEFFKQQKLNYVMKTKIKLLKNIVMEKH